MTWSALVGAAHLDKVAPLSFERLQLPRDRLRLLTSDAGVAAVLRGALADAACASDGQVTVLAGLRHGRAELLVPCLMQTIGLPIRLGEKVLFTLRLPSIRFTPAAQEGVRSPDDGSALLGWLRRQAPDRALVLTDVTTASALYAALAQAPALGYRVTKNEPDSHLFHRFGDSYAAFFNERSSKYKNQLRKKEKVFIGRVGTDFELREYRQPDAVKDFLDAASTINRKTYQFRLFGESVDNDEASVADSQRAAVAGRFRSFVLWHAGQPLCFVLGHQRLDGTYEHRQTGFDPEWRDFAPGIYCNVLLLQRLYAVDRPLLLDFGSGDSAYKRLFSNESRNTANPVLMPRRPRYFLAFWLHGAMASANQTAVDLLERWGLKDRVKRWLRGAA